MKFSRRSILAGALAVPATAWAQTNSAWPSALLMATGRPGGAYDVYGPAWGRLAEQFLAISIAYRASGGAASDILLIEQGAVQLGMTTVTVADQARTGTGIWTAGVKFENFRALFPMFPSILQIVSAQKTKIAAIRDLAGRTVGIGPDGGSGATSIQQIFASVGVIPTRFVTGDFSSQVRDMQAGILDACAFISAPPTPAIARAAQNANFNLIGFTPDETLQVLRAAPGMTPMPLPPGTFPGQSVAIASIGTPNFSIGAKSLPDPVVTALTLAAMRNRASLAQLIPAAATSPAPLLATPGHLTFHPAAALALRTLGLTVPQTLIES